MTQVTKSPEGREQVTTTWYVSPQKSRIEQVPVERSPMPTMVMIVRQDKGVVWNDAGYDAVSPRVDVILRNAPG